MTLKSNYLPKEGNLKTVRGKTRLATSKKKKIGFHFSLVKTRRIKLVSNFFFLRCKFQWLLVKEKRKFQFSLLHYSQSSRDKNCSCADEFTWFVSLGNEKDDTFSHQKLMFTIWNIREVHSHSNCLFQKQCI